MDARKDYIYGKHALEEALAHRPDVIRQVFFESEYQGHSLHDRMKNTDIPIHYFSKKHPPGSVSPEDAHQGVIAQIDAEKLLVDYKEFIENLDVTEDTGLVILGELQDPHNVGAVIRNAAAFGISGVLIPEHNQAPVSSTVVKVSAGTAFRIPLVSIGNVNTIIRQLKEHDFWVYGLEGEAEETLPEQNFASPTVFVLGNEATGIREKTQEHCDKLISIPTDERLPLNAAASTAVAFYGWQQR
ncbi:MAG: 23S rRNA (guanosine(2251)-2'-O)-methyltransferase RlmB [Candidatus Paceibacterota bacterium]